MGYHIKLYNFPQEIYIFFLPDAVAILNLINVLGNSCEVSDSCSSQIYKQWKSHLNTSWVCFMCDNSIDCVSEAGDRQLCIPSCTQNHVLMGAAIEGQNIALSGLYQYKICKFWKYFKLVKLNFSK